MKTSLSILALFLSAVSAAPLRARHGVVTMNSSSSQNIAAAVYFITNEPKGNFVVAGSVDVNAQVTFIQAVSTRGLGSHGISSPNGPDALFSQGAIKASTAGNILATVNAGSNTVSVFSINPKNPVDIKQLGQPVSSGGEFPMSLAIDKSGSKVCVLNGGQVSGVMCYKADNDLGLVPLNNTLRSLNLNQTTPPSGPAGTTSHIIFNEENTQLIASIKGSPPQQGFLAVWDIAEDFSLSESFTSLTPASGGALPFSMTLIPGQNALLATDPAIGFDIFDLSSANGTQSLNATSSKDSAVAIDGQGATCWSSRSNKTGNFYLTDITTSIVTEVSVDVQLKASIVKQYPQKAGSATIDNDIAKIGNNDFMFVLSANITTIEVLSLNAPGQAVSVGSFDASVPAKSAGLTINGDNVQGMTTYVM